MDNNEWLVVILMIVAGAFAIGAHFINPSDLFGLNLGAFR